MGCDLYRASEQTGWRGPGHSSGVPNKALYPMPTNKNTKDFFAS